MSDMVFCEFHQKYYNRWEMSGDCPHCIASYGFLVEDIESGAKEGSEWREILGYHEKKNPVYPTLDEWREEATIRKDYVDGKITLDEATKRSEQFAIKIRAKYHPDYKPKPQPQTPTKPTHYLEVPHLFGRIVAETTAQK